MRVCVTGASGAIGRRLVPQLIEAGHDVIGTHHSPASAELLRTLGAKPVMVDLLDPRAVRKAMFENDPSRQRHPVRRLQPRPRNLPLQNVARPNALPHQ